MADSSDKAQERGQERAHNAELKRQQAVVEAVEKAHKDELPKLGGPDENPGGPPGITLVEGKP